MAPSSMIPLFKVYMAPEAGPAVLDTLYSGYLTQGPKVEAFEAALRDWLHQPYVLTVNSGTSALQLALTLAGVGFGDKVISTPMTCSATNTAIRAVGADIVWADIDPISGNIDPHSVADILAHPEEFGKPKAVMAVDWAGSPCNWESLRNIADFHEVQLIEDAAHAFGATYQGQKLGAYADFTCYSFQAIKALTTADGGALVCRREADYKRGKLLRWFGIDREGPRQDYRCEADIVEPGHKYHMNDLNATIGLAQLPHTQEIVQANQANAAYFDVQLRGLHGVRLIPRRRNEESAHWMYTMHVEQRERFMAFMAQAGVATSKVHARNDLHTMFRAYRRALPGLEAFSTTQVSIPCGWWLSEADRTHIVTTIKTFTEQA